MGGFVKILKHLKNERLINDFRIEALFHAFEMYYDTMQLMEGGFDDDFYLYDEIKTGKTYRGNKKRYIVRILITESHKDYTPDMKYCKCFKVYLPYNVKYFLTN